MRSMRVMSSDHTKSMHIGIVVPKQTTYQKLCVFANGTARCSSAKTVDSESGESAKMPLHDAPHAMLPEM